MKPFWHQVIADKRRVTLTLRNANDFAVKGVEIPCSFSRRDGIHSPI